jgi:hypothetical protein
MHRELLHAERFLSPGARVRVDALIEALAAGFCSRERDGGAVLTAAHGDLVAAVLTELRAACDQHGVPWPETTETEIRDYLNRHLALDL